MCVLARLSLTLVLVAFATSVGSDELVSVTKYRGCVVDTQSHDISVSGSDKDGAWSIRYNPNSRFRIINILDANGRLADNL